MTRSEERKFEMWGACRMQRKVSVSIMRSDSRMVYQ